MSTGAFSNLYRQWAERGVHLYPTEFVVRTMLGTYPRHAFRESWDGAAVLDLGFGDGRNFPLLINLYCKIAGVEITEDIVALAQERFKGVELDLRVGTNARIPFDDASFDAVLACHSMYYLEDGDNFDDNLAEIARVLRLGGG
ncbi:class I SAM-dependent methyltransferase [Thiorhodovibrio litoralis]|uniref:class I SAM-dependent methyltransferase n=1 Tax=Thiorhodovibrio litoralis TaxID=2952932 RepID=UPI002B25EEA7|nr:class I SAM-dependent methyltransferase [Thiorhodovibrio litoralis]WPL14171.1 Demethylrebeccamycin-D-glucose O-methyltransferase [Thiorhodovibrio litoralis]